jgi:DNA-binding protein YbaB
VEQSDDLVAAISAKAQALEEASATLRRELAALRLTAMDRDRLVAATVAANGRMVDLDIGDAAMGLSPEDLATVILTTMRDATTEAALHTARLTQQVTDLGFDPVGMVADSSAAGDRERER